MQVVLSPVVPFIRNYRRKVRATQGDPPCENMGIQHNMRGNRECHRNQVATSFACGDSENVG